jgi:uncharacterized repeat protein (TIGR03803 family)
MNTRTHYTDNSWNSFNWRLPARADRLLLLRLLGLTLTLASIAPAQDYRVLKSFGALTNGSGYSPQAPLVQGPDGTLYGTTGSGDWPLMGTVFRMNTDGTGFSVLTYFTNWLEGANPVGGLVLSGSTLYGTTGGGGEPGDGYDHPGNGVVFKVNTDGSGYAVLKSFSGSDGRFPVARLLLAGSTLYGTTAWGGSTDDGVVFRVNTDGSGYAVLKSFTRSDGGYPDAGVVLAGSTLYGATFYGGSSDYGVIFQVNTDGSGYKVLKSLTDGDGAGPNAGLVLEGSRL